MQLLGIRGPPLVSSETAYLAGEFHAIQMADVLGNHIDHGKECAGSIQRTAGTSDDFDAVNQIDIELKLAADERAVIDVVVEAMPIEQHQDARVIVSRPGKSTHANIAIIAIVGDIKSPHAAQDVGQGAITTLVDLVRS